MRPYDAPWGVQPWDGRVVFKDSIQQIQLEPELGDDLAGFLPEGRADLVKWAREHWGKRGDGENFVKLMSRCIDPVSAWGDMGEDAKDDPWALPMMGNQFLPGGEEDVRIWPRPKVTVEDVRQRPSLGNTVVRRTLHMAEDACDRWAAMFVDHPNEFWRGRPN